MPGQEHFLLHVLIVTGVIKISERTDKGDLFEDLSAMQYK